MDHNSRIQALNDLIAHGLTQADAMKAFGERTDEGLQHSSGPLDRARRKARWRWTTCLS
jgi:hypothetical protein